MSFTEVLDLYLWEIAVLLGKDTPPESDTPDTEIDSMLRAMNPRQPSPDRKG